MNSLPSSVIHRGNIIGLGESSHGSKNECEWRYGFILEAIQNNPDTAFVCYFEAYEDPFAELTNGIPESTESLDQLVRKCLGSIYAIWQTRETYVFLLELVKLISRHSRDIKIIGIDFRNTEHKQSLDAQEMLRMRDSYMFENIQKRYHSDALHVVMAHNAHIGRYSDTDKSIGYLLNQEFSSSYIPIAQHVSMGTVRARWNGGDYQPVSFTYDGTPGSMTALSQTLFVNHNSAQTRIFETSDSIFADTCTMQQIGFYLPLEQPWILPFGKNYFDYVVLHAQSESAEQLPHIT